MIRCNVTQTAVAWRFRSKNLTRIIERTPHRSSACSISCRKRRRHRGLRMASACAQSFKADRFPSWSRASTTPIRFSRRLEKARLRAHPVSWSGPTRAPWTTKPPPLPRCASQSRAIPHGRGCRTSRESVTCSPLGCCRGWMSLALRRHPRSGRTVDSGQFRAWHTGA
jgi:hypothetical protein